MIGPGLFKRIIKLMQGEDEIMGGGGAKVEGGGLRML